MLLDIFPKHHENHQKPIRAEKNKSGEKILFGPKKQPEQLRAEKTA